MFWFGFVILCLYLAVDRIIRLLKIKNFTNKHVFITGCDSGFGRGLAIQLDTLGFPVFAGCLTDAGIESLQKICSSRLRALRVDVTDDISIKDAETFIRQKLTGEDDVLWAVVNNAGVTGLTAPIEMCSRQDFLNCCQVNLFGPIQVARTFLPLLRKSKGGRLVNMTSVMGRFPAASGPYCVSKFGMEAFTDVLRHEISDQGVKVVAIEPGYHKTPLLRLDSLVDGISQAFGRSSPEVQNAYGGASFIDRARALMSATFERSSDSTHDVVDVYVEALTCSYPRTRYLVGWDAWVVFSPMSYLPDWVGDWILHRGQAHLLQENGIST